jgi:hypothetical protein
MTTNQTTDHVLITHDDQGPILAIATWFLLTVMFLAVAARMTIKIAVRRQLKIEDYSVMAALVRLKAMHVILALFADIRTVIWNWTISCSVLSRKIWLRATTIKFGSSKFDQH